MAQLPKICSIFIVLNKCFRRCSKLNKRFLKTSDATKQVQKILGDLINDIFERDELVAAASEDESDMNKVRVTKKDLNWSCPICSVVIKHRQNVLRHKSTCPPVKKNQVAKPKEKMPSVFKCNYCQATFSLQKSLKSHIKRNHLEQFCLQYEHTLFKCSACDFQTIGEKYLKTHFKKFHMDKGNLCCDICERRYSNKDSLRVHMKSHLTIKRSFVCEVCGCIIVTSSDQDTHVCTQQTESAESGSGISHQLIINGNEISNNKSKEFTYNNNNNKLSQSYSVVSNTEATQYQHHFSHNSRVINPMMTSQHTSDKSCSDWSDSQSENPLFMQQPINQWGGGQNSQFMSHLPMSRFEVNHTQSLLYGGGGEGSQLMMQSVGQNNSLFLRPLESGQDYQDYQYRSDQIVENDSEAGSSDSSKNVQIVEVDGLQFVKL